MRDQPGFFTFFCAVLAALLAHDLLRLAFAALGLSLVFGSFSKSPSSTTPGHLPARPGAVAPRAESLPEWPGPIKAFRDRSSRACINGVVADFVDNGWVERRNQKCKASSP